MAWDNQRSGDNVQAQEAEVTKQELLRLKRELDRTRTHAVDRPRVGPMPSPGEGKDGDVRWVFQGGARTRLERVQGQWVSSASGAAPAVSPLTGQIVSGPATTIKQAVLHYSIVNMNKVGGLAANQVLPVGMTFTQFVAALALLDNSPPVAVASAKETNRIWFGG